MKITLKEISEQTGLSVSVLSRVASGNGYVSEDKRIKAEHALETYGYRRSMPHPAGAQQMDDVILVIAGATGNTYQEIIRRLTSAAHKASKKVLTAHTDYSSALEEEYLRFAQRMGVYGVIMLSAPENRSTSHLIRECTIPIVLVARYTSMTSTDIVTQDSYEMGTLACQKFLAAGHTRLGYLGGHMESSITRDKQLGYADQLVEAGLSLLPEWTAFGALSYQSGAEYARQLLRMDNAPTALFVSNDLMAMGLADTLLDAGVRVPQDLSLICCDKTLASDTYHLALDRMYIDWGETVPTVMRLLNARRSDPSRPRRMVTFDTLYLPGETIAAPRERAALLPR